VNATHPVFQPLKQSSSPQAIRSSIPPSKGSIGTPVTNNANIASKITKTMKNMAHMKMPTSK
jgi:hypothetical protein